MKREKKKKSTKNNKKFITRVQNVNIYYVEKILEVWMEHWCRSLCPNPNSQWVTLVSGAVVVAPSAADIFLIRRTSPPAREAPNTR